MGIGETMLDWTEALSVRVRDLENPKILLKKLEEIQEKKWTGFASHVDLLPEERDTDVRMLIDNCAPALFANAMITVGKKLTVVGHDFLKHRGGSHVIFEGAQGVLLDEWYGFHPYTTWSTTRTANAECLLKDIDFRGEVNRLGVLRAYHTRHGVGPFPTENRMMTDHMGDIHNGTGEWQGTFRVGWFDAVLAKYAIEVTELGDRPIHSIALTNVDRMDDLDTTRNIATSYRFREPSQRIRGKIKRIIPKKSKYDLIQSEDITRLIEACEPVYDCAPLNNDKYIELIEQEIKKNVSIISRGPRAQDKREVGVLV